MSADKWSLEDREWLKTIVFFAMTRLSRAVARRTYPIARDVIVNNI